MPFQLVFHSFLIMLDVSVFGDVFRVFPGPGGVACKQREERI